MEKLSYVFAKKPLDVLNRLNIWNNENTISTTTELIND
jgi:hypothetical protein